MNQIKINRALKLSTIGKFPGSARAMLDRIPQSACDALTARQLAEMIDAMWDACREAKAIASHEASQDGVIWDVRRQVMREIVTINA